MSSHQPSQNEISNPINFSIEDEEKLQSGIWTKDPLFENLNTKPLRLLALNELPLQSPISKNLSPFWEENLENEKNTTKNDGKLSINTLLSPLKQKTPISSPNTNLLRFSYVETEEKPNKTMVKEDVRIVEEEAIKEKVLANMSNTPYIKTKLKKITSEKE